MKTDTPKRWHWEDIKASLRKKRYPLKRIAHEKGYSPKSNITTLKTSAGQTLKKSSPISSGCSRWRFGHRATKPMVLPWVMASGGKEALSCKKGAVPQSLHGISVAEMRARRASAPSPSLAASLRAATSPPTARPRYGLFLYPITSALSDPHWGCAIGAPSNWLPKRGLKYHSSTPLPAASSNGFPRK